MGNGVITNLGTLPGEQQSAPTDINDAGQIIGTMGAWLWDNGTIIDLGVLSGSTSSSGAIGMNNVGQVVGVSYGGIPDQAFIWEGGAMTRIGNIGEGDSVAFAINNEGQAVEYYKQTVGATAQAFLWENGVRTEWHCRD